MNKWESDVKSENWYIINENRLSELLIKIKKDNDCISPEAHLRLLEAKLKNKEILTEYERTMIEDTLDYFSLLSEHYKQIHYFYAGYFGKVENYEELLKDLEYYKNQAEYADSQITYSNKVLRMSKEQIKEENSKIELEESIDKYNKNDAIFMNKYQGLIIGNEYHGVTFDTLINGTDNKELSKWYKFLKELHENPYRNFFLNENTVCNFKIVFRNPKTGLYTDKESILQLGHSTSSKKTPVFSLGYNTHKAYSTGVKLLAGTIVTNNFENIPFPYLHAISYSNHISAEDLPPLDLYIIPIKHINPNGRFEIIMIKGIQFIDMKQNDNAASTGLYYAFQYFAEDISVIDYEDISSFYKLDPILEEEKKQEQIQDLMQQQSNTEEDKK